MGNVTPASLKMTTREPYSALAAPSSKIAFSLGLSNLPVHVLELLIRRENDDCCTAFMH